MARITELRRYPLKGARGTWEESLLVDPRVGVIGDRRWALKRKPSVPDDWSPKGMFYVGMNTPAMVAHQGPVFDATKPLTADGLNQFADSYLGSMANYLGLDEPPALLDTEGKFNITDTEGATISFLNLASVDELSRFMGMEVNPYRFRMNVHLEGLPAFEELDWVNGYPGDQIVTIGGLRFRIDDACERCKATEANPETGQYDLELLEALEAMMRERGYPGSPHRGKYTVMGVIARPLDRGYISRDENLVRM